jgi:hypothetical protein
MRLFAIVLALGTTALLSATAHADEQKLGDPGSIILSAERISPLLAFNSRSSTRDQAGTEVTETDRSTTVALFANPSAFSMYNVPRLAFDYSVGGGLTVGASAMVFVTLSAKEEVETGGTSRSEDSGKATAFGIGPRIGYVLPLASIASFWPRVGFSYTTLKVESPERTVGTDTISSSTSQSQAAVHFEPLFAITPVSHFAFTIGPVVDIPLTGTQKSESKRNGVTTSSEFDVSYMHFGLTAGLLGYF